MTIIEEREEQYGGFENVARVSHGLRKAFMDGGEPHFTPEQSEAIFMCLHKLARIRCGAMNHYDSWIDASNYLALGARRLEPEI